MSVENSDISKNGFKQISRYRGVLMGIVLFILTVIFAIIRETKGELYD